MQRFRIKMIWPAVLLAALALAACGGSTTAATSSAPAQTVTQPAQTSKASSSPSQTSLIDTTRTVSRTLGISGQVVSISGDIVTVRGQLDPGNGATGPIVTRQVKLWSGPLGLVKVGDHVYYSESKSGGFAENTTDYLRDIKAMCDGSAATNGIS